MEQNESTLIVVDDDPMMPKIIEKITGLRALSYSSGARLINEQTASCAIVRPDPVALFIDICLTGDENGLHTIPFLRHRFPFCPIIVIWQFVW